MSPRKLFKKLVSPKVAPDKPKAEKPKQGRPYGERMSVDAEWFKEQMRAVGLRSFAELSRSIGIDKAMMSKSLTGERTFAVKDVIRLADALRTSPEEVIRRIGYSVAPTGIPIIGKIMKDGRVSTVTTRKGDTFALPAARPGAQALIAEGLVGYENAVFIYLPDKQLKTSLASIVKNFGHPCVVEADDHVTPWIGTLLRGSKNLIVLDVFGMKQIEIQELHSVAPVLSIHFP